MIPSRRVTLATALLLVVPGSALAGKKKDKDAPAVTPAMMTVSPPQNVFVRNAWDTDPSRYLGRFLPEGTAPLDEASSAKKQCSTYVTWTKIGAGGVAYDELFQVSDTAAASLGFPPVLSASGSGSQTRMARIKYTATNKMVGDIEDPAGFEACCKQAPDQCTSRYVGEFLEGAQGQVYFAVGNAADVQADGLLKGVAGQVEVAHGMAWQQGRTWDSPVYFAFKAHLTGWSDGGVVTPAGCGDWVNAPPRSSQGMYFVGVSEFLPSESKAREAALLKARESVVKWLGESITTGSTEVSGYTGDVGALSIQLQQESFLQAAASGVASMVKDENWCLEPAATPAGVLTKAKVLAFLPKSQYTAAAGALAGAGPGSGPGPGAGAP